MRLSLLFDFVAHREFGAGRRFGADLLTAQAEDAMLVDQHLVEEHQFVLNFDRKSGAALAAFHQDQLLEVFLAFGITPQAGDGLDDARERFECGGFTGAFALEHFALAKQLLRQRGVDNSVLNCHWPDFAPKTFVYLHRHDVKSRKINVFRHIA